MNQAKMRYMMYERGISQREVAGVLELTPKTISAKMCGKQDFTYTEVVKLCELLGIENPLGVIETKK